jgi:hypothetical protein
LKDSDIKRDVINLIDTSHKIKLYHIYKFCSETIEECKIVTNVLEKLLKKGLIKERNGYIVKEKL